MTQGQDLLTGSVPKKLIRFAFPLFLANLLQALYNVVDMLVVGKIVGKTGLAAISNASMLCFIINSICIGLTMGGSVLVAQCKGANDQTGQRDTIGMLFFLSLVGSAVVAILGLAIYEALFQALNVPANAYQDACGYMKIICCGTVFVFGYNAVCSILKGLGDSQTPLFFVGVAMWCWMCFWLGRFPWARQAQPGPLSRLRVFPLWLPWYIYGGINRAFLLEKSSFIGKSCWPS